MAGLRPQVSGDTYRITEVLAPGASKGARPVRGRLVQVKAKVGKPFWNKLRLLSHMEPNLVSGRPGKASIVS